MEALPYSKMTWPPMVAVCHELVIEEPLRSAMVTCALILLSERLVESSPLVSEGHPQEE